MIGYQRLILALGLVLVAGNELLAQGGIEELAEKCETICQTADAPWRSIPWQVDLLDAQKMAVVQSKPLFIWAMDGHPLACT